MNNSIETAVERRENTVKEYQRLITERAKIFSSRDSRFSRYNEGANTKSLASHLEMSCMDVDTIFDPAGTRAELEKFSQ